MRGKGRRADRRRQGSEAVLAGADPLPAQVEQCAVAGRSRIGAPAYAITRFEHAHVKALRVQFPCRCQARQPCAYDYHIGALLVRRGV